MDNIIKVYDRDMNKLAYLHNAYAIGYSLELNELWNATFTLPAVDSKNIHCQPFNYVEIFDGSERIELFRIMPSTLTRNTKGDIVYKCEHVLATLLDDVMFKYHQMGNIGVGTAQVIRYILDQQLVKRWQLGQCDFDRRFEYKWENENLLAALFSVPQPFNEKYRWEFDTTGSIWRINLKRLSTEFKADITYRKNMLEIKKTVDPTSIVTRLYCLGYGEGDNQLGIESVNNGIPYLESNGAITTWGIKQSILVDRRFENPETLKAYGQSLLDELKHPYISYETSAVDLYRLSPTKHLRFIPGDVVRINDTEDNIIEDLPIVRVTKNDVTGRPADVDIEIANKTRDMAGSISELQERARINEVYAQGATNQMIIPYADNADSNNPSVLRVYIPDTMARINKCILNYRLESFRAFSKAIGGGGGSTLTSSSGGGGSTTSSDGGGMSSSTVNSDSVSETSSSGGGGTTNADVEIYYPGASQDYTMTAGDPPHSHGLYRHGHRVDLPFHSHEVRIPRHNHRFYIDDHYHRINLPTHNHRINIPEHTHNLQFGIYQGDRASKVTIKVDGKTIPQTQENTDINIIDYLAVDSSGKVQRNTWHEIEIIPDKMSRIVANVFMQIFTNSRGGGDY